MSDLEIRWTDLVLISLQTEDNAWQIIARQFILHLAHRMRLDKLCPAWQACSIGQFAAQHARVNQMA